MKINFMSSVGIVALLASNSANAVCPSADEILNELKAMKGELLEADNLVKGRSIIKLKGVVGTGKNAPAALEIYDPSMSETIIEDQYKISGNFYDFASVCGYTDPASGSSFILKDS